MDLQHRCNKTVKNYTDALGTTTDTAMGRMDALKWNCDDLQTFVMDFIILDNIVIDMVLHNPKA